MQSLPTRAPNRLLIITFLAAASALGATYGVLFTRYTELRDGRIVDGKVIDNRQGRIAVGYTDAHAAGRRLWRRVPAGTTEYPIGATVKLHESAHRTAFADEVRAPSLLYPLGIALCLLLASVAWRGTQPLPPAFDEGDVERIVIRALAGSARRLNLAGAIMIGCSVFIASVLGLAPLDKLAEMIVLGCLLATALGLAAWTLARAWQLRDPRSATVYQRICKRPEEIAWFYTQIATRGGAGQETMAIHFVDGAKLDILLTDVSADELADALRTRAPRAARGWSPELAVQFSGGRGAG